MSDPLAATPIELFARLDALGIHHRTVEHPPLFTVEDSKALRGSLPGAHCKSLFLKDKKGALWLVVCLEDRRLDMKGLSDAIGSARLSFGKPDLMERVLGVTPGSVTPFALINRTAGDVRVVLDVAMLRDYETLNYHPLVNTQTTAIASSDLLPFVAGCGHEPVLLDLDRVDRNKA